MNQNQRNKLAEAMRLIREVMSENGSEQLPLISAPEVADLSNLRKPTVDFARALYRTFGMKSINCKDQQVIKMQAETGMMRMDGFLYTMNQRQFIDTTYHDTLSGRKIAKSFRFVKTIPQ